MFTRLSCRHCLEDAPQLDIVPCGYRRHPVTERVSRKYDDFIRFYESQEQELRDRIARAREILPDVSISDEMLKMIAQVCIDMGVDGHRADITMMKAAATIAAYNGRNSVDADDIREAATLVLPHRMRRRPFSEQQMDRKRMEQSIQKFQGQTEVSTGTHQHTPIH